VERREGRDAGAGGDWDAASRTRGKQGEGGVCAFGLKPEGRVLLFFSVSLFFSNKTYFKTFSKPNLNSF